MFFERTGRVPGVWDVDAATWSVGAGDLPDPDGALLAAIEEDFGWDPEIPPTYVVVADDSDGVFDTELAELLAECEFALESAARDESLVGGWVW